jgi:hypothetical protein
MNTILKKFFILSLLINKTFFPSFDNKLDFHSSLMAYAAGSGILAYMSSYCNNKANENERQLLMIMDNIRGEDGRRPINFEEQLNLAHQIARDSEAPEAENIRKYSVSFTMNRIASIASGWASFVLLNKTATKISEKNNCQLI